MFGEGAHQREALVAVQVHIGVDAAEVQPVAVGADEIINRVGLQRRAEGVGDHEGVRARSAAQQVAALAADDGVVAGPAIDAVIAAGAVDTVVAGVALDVVADAIAGDADVAGPRQLQGLDLRDQRPAVDADPGRVDALAGQFDDGVLQVVDDIEVVADPADQQVGAAPAVQGVGGLAALQPVIAGAAVQIVVALTATQSVVAAIAIQLVHPQGAHQLVVVGSTVQGVVAVATVQPVLAGVAVEEVVADAAVQPVGPIVALQAVVAGRADQPVVVVAAEQEVIAVAAIELVVGAEAIQLVDAGPAVQPVARGRAGPGLGQGRTVEDDAAQLAEHQEGRARAAVADVRAARADQEVIQAVAVDVTGCRNRPARLVVGELAGDLEAVAPVQTGQLQGRREAAPAVDDVAGSAGAAPVRVGQVGADQEIGPAVAVDVSCPGHRPSGPVACQLAVDAKSVGPVQGRKGDIGAPGPAMTEHHIGPAGIALPGRIERLGPDDDVGIAVGIDVAGSRHRGSDIVARRRAVQLEPVGPIQAGQIEVGGPAAGLAKHHPGAAGVSPIRIGVLRADDQVRQTITVDVTRRGDRGSGQIVGQLAVDTKAVAPVETAQGLGRRERSAFAEQHVDRARRVQPVGVMQSGGDHQVVDPVAVDIRHGRHRPAGVVARRRAGGPEAVGSVQGGQVDRVPWPAVAEDDIGRPRIKPGQVRFTGADHDIAEAVVVQVAGREHREAGLLVAEPPLDDEAAGPVQTLQSDAGAPAARLAEHHIGRAGIGAAGVVVGGADDQVGKAVAVDVARPADRETGLVAAEQSVELHTIGAIQAVQVEHRRKRHENFPRQAPHGLCHSWDL